MKPVKLLPSWAYRIVGIIEVPPGETQPEIYYTVREVLIRDGKPGSIVLQDTSPSGEDEEEFLKEAERYMRGLTKEPIYFDNDKNEFVKRPEWEPKWKEKK